MVVSLLISKCLNSSVYERYIYNNANLLSKICTNNKFEMKRKTKFHHFLRRLIPRSSTRGRTMCARALKLLF